MMRMRSTGLGETELVGEVKEITRVGAYLVLLVNTTEPVRWHVRTGMSSGDLFKVLWLMFKPSCLIFLITSFASK